MKKVLIIAIFFFLSSLLYAQEPELVLPIGHTSSFDGLYFSPDGNKIATVAFKDPRVVVWDVKTGKLLTSFIDGGAYLGFKNIIFSSDGKKLFADSKSGGGTVWDIEKKKILLQLTLEKDSATGIYNYDFDTPIAASFSADAATIAVATGSLVSIIDLASEQTLKTFTGHTEKIIKLAHSKDGKYLLCSSEKNTEAWQIDNYTKKRSFSKEEQLFFSPTGNIIISAGNADIKVIDAGTGQLLKKLEYQSPSSITFSPDGTKMVVVAASHAAVWDMRSWQLLYQWDNISGAWFLPDNKNILLTRPGAVNNTGNKIEVWDAVSYKLVRSRNGLLEGVINEQGDKMANQADEIIQVINTKTGTVLREWNWHGHIPNYVTTIGPRPGRFLTRSSHLNIWDGETGTMLSSAFIGYDENSYESYAEVMFAGKTDLFIIVKRGNWQVWNSRQGKVVLQSTKTFNGNLKGAISKNGQQAAIVYQNKLQGNIEVYDLQHPEQVKKFRMGISPVQEVFFSPDNTRLVISYENGKNTEIRLATTFAVIKTVPGICNGEFSPDGSLVITALSSAKDTISYLWNTDKGSLSGKYNGIARFSPNANKIVTSQGHIVDLTQKEADIQLEAMDDYTIEFFSGPPYFSPDGNKVMGIQRNGGSGGYPDEVYVWDAATGKLIIPDTVGLGFNFISSSGKKRLSVYVNGEDDMKIIGLDENDTVTLSASRDDVWAGYAEFSSDDKYVYTSNDQTVKKWDAATGRLLYTFFPVDSTSYLTMIPSGYYSCSPEAARVLHYVKGTQVISFNQLDIRYNRPDKVLEHLQYPDTALTAAYRKVYIKRIKKSGIDTSYFRSDYAVPEADFINRDAIEDEQNVEQLTLRIHGSDSIYLLDHINIWVNEVPLFGLKGIRLLKRSILSFDTTLTIDLSQGENRIETSVTNANGIESYRSPLLVKYNPSKANAKIEKIHFIGIGINNFATGEHNLSWSVKDIRDLAISFKKKYGNNCYIDTLFNKDVTTPNIKSLKDSLYKTAINDKVIIAYSGHGLLSKGFDYYLSTYAVNFNKPEENGLPYDELENLMDSIPARKKLMLIDACHSGEVDKEELAQMKQVQRNLDSTQKGLIILVDSSSRRLGSKNSVELMQRLFANVGKSTGATIISASAGTQFALERNDLKNGVFTYSILEAMKTNATMKISKLKTIVGKRVEELTKGLQKPTSRNETIVVDWDIW